jgi:hypothetical protein
VFLEVMEVLVEVPTHRALPVSVDLSLNILFPSLSHLQLKDSSNLMSSRGFFEKTLLHEKRRNAYFHFQKSVRILEKRTGHTVPPSG